VKKRLILAIYLFYLAFNVFGQVKIDINGAVEWDKMEINAAVSLDLASADIKLPSGRTQGEMIITSEYLRLIRPKLLNIQVDSSSTIADLIERGEWTLADAEKLAINANMVPPVISRDFSSLSASYSMGIDMISSVFIRHEHTAEIPRTLFPVRPPVYTGIIIIAYEELPIHGRNSQAFLRPCLFPKIWDSEMNLIFERNNLNPKAGSMVKYFSRENIFANRPSGLSPEIAAIVGERPLKVFAQGVFGMNPTDPIINRDDVLQIISTSENRSLLREGRLAFILDEKMLKEKF